MSSPARSPSPAESLRSSLPDVLTPSRKIQALLAQFDDSDSDPPSRGPSASTLNRAGQDKNGPSAVGRDVVSRSEDESEDEDILPAAPRSRIAARLQGLSDVPAVPDKSKEQSVSEATQQAESNTSEDGEEARPTMRRRLLTKRKSSPMRQAPSPGAPRSPHHSSLPSPSAIARDVASEQHVGSEHEEGQSTVAKSKFLALVEKHRKQRLVKEAEEAAKKAARLEALKSQEAETRHPRGSSPADDSDEDSDISGNDAAKKLAKGARPTRKASKKAIEEMNRETQRMTRNMQLAHQARTKKKITKESLLARFNFSTSTFRREQKTPELDHDNPITDSSRAGSDIDAARGHDTPPTSPMIEGTATGSPKNPMSHVDRQLLEPGLEAEHEAGEDSVQSRPKLDKGKGRALSEEPIEYDGLSFTVRPTNVPTAQPLLHKASEQPLKPTVKPFQSKWSLATLKSGDDDSDSDLEIVTTRGDIRKYAAFEHLPKRKAKEASSHLALRTLANLIATDDRKQTVNAAQLETSLRQAARMQARKERQEKIEELKARGIMIQTAEEREREQQEVEDLLERARQEAAEIQKREKALAKKDGTFIKDGLEDDDDDESDADFEGDDEEDIALSDEEDDGEAEEEDGDDEEGDGFHDGEEANDNLIHEEADEEDSAGSVSSEEEADMVSQTGDALESEDGPKTSSRKGRTTRVLSDDEEEGEGEETTGEKPRSPRLPAPAKTPQSILRSARKQIPGLQMSDDLPIGLTQAFDGTMADSQSQTTQEQDSLTMTMDLPSPNIAMVPRLNRLDSIDMISDSQPGSQTQPLNISFSFPESQRVPQSPAAASIAADRQLTPSQAPFEPTQDGGYILTPFGGNRFATETPQQAGPHSTMDTVLLAQDIRDSPTVQRKSRLRRGHANAASDDEQSDTADTSAFDIMRQAAKQKKREMFDKSKSNAREIVDDAAEESEDEYAGLGGASDEDVNDEENEDDRNMIDEDTQVGAGDKVELAKLYADRERQQDEAAVAKLMKDITTGALRRKRGNDDLGLSDEEDAIVRRREAKRRAFEKMRRELLKDEAVGKIAEDKKKEAFLRSIEDRHVSDDEDDFDLPETPVEDDSQTASQTAAQPDKSQDQDSLPLPEQGPIKQDKRPLAPTEASRLNQARRSIGHGKAHLNRKPATLAEIRESVSFLIEERDSQAATIDLGLSDSEDEPEAYVNLDRHFQAAEADENADDGEDLGDFIVDDHDTTREDNIFKKPTVPYSETRASFSERRTKERPNVVNRLSMLRQSSSSSGSSSSTKMAFYTGNTTTNGSFNKVPTLLRRATTNSSLGSKAGRDETVSATGVVTNLNRTERGKAGNDKEFIRKGTGGQRNAVNYRPTVREEKMSQRAGIAKKQAAKNKKAKGGFLGGLFGQSSWA